MAITKDGTISGPVSKPRRGISPLCNGGNRSSTVLIGTRRSPSPSLSEKPAPSYLRPTVSSQSEVKKKVLLSPDNAAKKSVLARRSSMDRPPAASHLQKIISSTPRERSVTVKSSSFSGSLGTSYRPVSEKASAALSKTAKAVSRTTHPGYNSGGKTVARKSAATKKEESSDNASTVVDDASGNDNSGTSSVPEGENLPSPTREKMGEVAKMVAVAEDENAAMIQGESEDVMEDHHHVAHPENDVAVKEEVLPEEVVVSVGEEDDQNSRTAAQLQMEEIVSYQVSNSIAAAAAEAEDKEEGEHIVQNDMDAKEDKEVGDVVEMAANSEIKMSAGEKQSKNKEGEEERRLVAKPSDNFTTVTSTRKDPVQANNDVIEETAKKLMKLRKNKVRALTGAFETVISLEKPNKA